MSQGYHRVDGDMFQFIGTFVVYRTGNDVYRAASKSRHTSPSEIRREHLTDSTLIPMSAFSPPFSSDFHTQAPCPLPESTFTKRPALISYSGPSSSNSSTATKSSPQQPSSIADLFLKEVQVCEVLKRHPHPNVAPYLGCEVSQERITGICFPRYRQTLMQVVNPDGLSKRDAKLLPGDNTRDWSHILAGIESGIRHLHSLGIVHNDINPSNIMMDGDTPVIIDFGSCRRVGQTLTEVGRTYEWHNEKVRVSLRKNDMDALEEIRIWLGQSTKSFMFQE